MAERKKEKMRGWKNSESETIDESGMTEY